MAAEIRKALKYIPPEHLIVSSDCGFGRQGCNRDIAFYKASAIAQGANIVRRELGFETTRALGLRTIQWTVAGFDWKPRSAGRIASDVLRGTGAG